MLLFGGGDFLLVEASSKRIKDLLGSLSAWTFAMLVWGHKGRKHDFHSFY